MPILDHFLGDGNFIILGEFLTLIHEAGYGSLFLGNQIHRPWWVSRVNSAGE